jgi:hypothetical protein
MDYVPLVEPEIEDGRQLMARLATEGVEVIAASWIWDGEDGKWSLFLASPIVDRLGQIKAYSRVQPLIRQMPAPFSIHPFDVKLIGVTDPITKDPVAYRDRYPGRTPPWFRGARLGEQALATAAYVYPPILALSPSVAADGGG